MSVVKLEELWPRVICFFPFYSSDGGNGTRVLLEDGREEVDNRKTKTLLEAMAKIFAADLAALRCKYRGMLGHKGLVPLPLHCSMILVPLKVRRVRYKDHGATGYAVLDRIKGVEAVETTGGEGEKGILPLEPEDVPVTRIMLDGGRFLDSTEKLVTVKKRVAEALEVKEDYTRFHRGRRGFPLAGSLVDSLEGEREKVVYHIHYHTSGFPGEPRLFRAAESGQVQVFTPGSLSLKSRS